MEPWKIDPTLLGLRFGSRIGGLIDKGASHWCTLGDDRNSTHLDHKCSAQTGPVEPVQQVSNNTVRVLEAPEISVPLSAQPRLLLARGAEVEAEGCGRQREATQLTLCGLGHMQGRLDRRPAKEHDSVQVRELGDERGGKSRVCDLGLPRTTHKPSLLVLLLEHQEASGCQQPHYPPQLHLRYADQVCEIIGADRFPARGYACQHLELAQPSEARQDLGL